MGFITDTISTIWKKTWKFWLSIVGLGFMIGFPEVHQLFIIAGHHLSQLIGGSSGVHIHIPTPKKP